MNAITIKSESKLTITPALLAQIFWEMDDSEQGKFFDELGTLVLSTPAPFTRDIGSMFGLDYQMCWASQKCTPLGRDVMSRFSEQGVRYLRPDLLVEGLT